MRTLGIFAKQPVPGRVKTRLAADWGHERAAALYECFLRDQLEKFENCGDRRVIGFAPATDAARRWFESTAALMPSTDCWTLWPQPDSHLGDRMQRFFESWTESSEHRTILIGSDSPTLPKSCLDQAWQLLETHDCVIGPATDGGYYLIGLNGSNQDFVVPFRDIDWSTPQVLEQTVAALRNSRVSLGLLPPWYDVDSAAGVSTLTGHLLAMIHSNAEVHLKATTRFLGID